MRAAFVTSTLVCLVGLLVILRAVFRQHGVSITNQGERSLRVWRIRPFAPSNGSEIEKDSMGELEALAKGSFHGLHGDILMFSARDATGPEEYVLVPDRGTHSAGRASIPASSEAALATVHVVYAGDKVTFRGLLGSMLSVSQHLTEPTQCAMHVIVPEKTMPRARAIVRCFLLEHVARFKAPPAVLLHTLLGFPYQLNASVHRLLKPATFARFYIPKYLPNAPRAIYLDIDTIVKVDLGLLYRMPMMHGLAAVLEDGGNKRGAEWFFPHQNDAVKRLWKNWTRLENYRSSMFNSGVMLLDLERWRSEDIVQALEGWVQKTGILLNADMLPLNLAFEGRWDHLDLRWNVQGRGSPLGCKWSEHLIQEAHILHWSCSDCKPWDNCNHAPGSPDLYWQLAESNGTWHCSKALIRQAKYSSQQSTSEKVKPTMEKEL